MDSEEIPLPSSPSITAIVNDSVPMTDTIPTILEDNVQMIDTIMATDSVPMPDSSLAVDNIPLFTNHDIVSNIIPEINHELTSAAIDDNLFFNVEDHDMETVLENTAPPVESRPLPITTHHNVLLAEQAVSDPPLEVKDEQGVKIEDVEMTNEDEHSTIPDNIITDHQVKIKRFPHL